MLKIHLKPHCNHILVNERSRHISSLRQASTIQASLFQSTFLQFQHILFINRSQDVSMCIYFLYIYIPFPSIYKSGSLGFRLGNRGTTWENDQAVDPSTLNNMSMSKRLDEPINTLMRIHDD
jgi:hypothetical protein